MINMFKTSFLIIFIITILSCSKDKTSIPIPIISTKFVSSITLSSAISGGEISNISSEITMKGICWSTNQAPTTQNNKATDNSSNNSFSLTMSGLISNTVYYVRAFATNSSGTGYGDPISFTTKTNYSGQSGTVTDGEGNTYPTIGIGSQIWMASNLGTSKYNDGTPIQLVSSNSEWLHTTIEYCLYNNDIGNKTIYGALYNWYTIDPSYNNDKNVCPVGWHIPSKTEFQTLIDYLGPDAANKIKESGNSHWFVGNTGTNESGFTALPGGIRNDSNGEFQFLRDDCYLWTSTSSQGSDAYRMHINLYTATATFMNSKLNGYSIRCVKDQD